MILSVPIFMFSARNNRRNQMKYTIWTRLLVVIALVLSLSACGKAAPTTKTAPPVENLNDYPATDARPISSACIGSIGNF